MFTATLCLKLDHFLVLNSFAARVLLLMMVSLTHSPITSENLIVNNATYVTACIHLVNYFDL